RSCAMRQSFSILPPRIVSRKCTFQLSRGSVLASAAATPPSAMTACALPRSDLQTRPTEQPCAAASIAARRPAPPAPITRASWRGLSYRSGITRSQQARVWDDARRDEPDVEVGGADRDEADPRKGHVVFVQATRASPHRVLRACGGAAGEAVEAAPD